MSERLTVLLAVAGGGSIGALLRYSLSGWEVKKFPMGTLTVNVVGCLLIGMILGSLHDKDWISPAWRHFLVIGVLGSLTTFSTFGYQSVELAYDGDYGLSILNVLTNVIIGFSAVALGLTVAHALAKP